MKTIALDAIALDASTQTRAALSDSVVTEYAEALLDGAQFPPVVLFWDGTTYYIADGFHRILAAQAVGNVTITAEVRPGTGRDALWFGLGANREHGHRMTPADRRHTIVLALEQWLDMTQADIAAHVGCTRQRVQQVQAELEGIRQKANICRPSTGPITGSPDEAADEPAPADDAEAQRVAQRAQIEPLLREGLSRKEICRRLGVSHHPVDAVRRELGMVGVPGGQCAKYAKYADHAAAIKQLLRDDVTIPAIERQLGVSEYQVRRAKREVEAAERGLPPPPAAPPTTRTAKDRADRLQRMRDMASEGCTSRQIAAAAGIGYEQTRVLLRRFQIDVPADRVIGRAARLNATRIVETMVMDAENLTADVELIDFSELDPARITEYVTSLIASRKGLERFIARLYRSKRIMKQHKQPPFKTAGRPSKVRMVPINKMQTPPALITQRRFRKAHGDRLANELDLNKLGLPIINYRDGVYWVVDGQHRIYALRQNDLGDELLECQVFEDLTDAEMADTFLAIDDRKAVAVYDKFHIACTAGHERELEIQRTVETQNLKISQDSKCEKSISAISALGKVYDRSGSTVLGQILRVLRDGYGGDPKAFDAYILDGLGLVFDRYGARLDESVLVRCCTASANGARGLLRRADAQRERTGNQKALCIAAALVEMYNRAVDRGKKLQSWWKEAEAPAVATPPPSRAHKANGQIGAPMVRLPQTYHHSVPA